MQDILMEKVNNYKDKERYEIINGKVYMMAPASPVHERICASIIMRLGEALKGKPCDVYSSSLAVYLSGDVNDKNYFMPDITVACDKSKISGRGHEGAPTLVIEILSSDPGHDRVEKFNAYLQAGVQEYWIVDPVDKIVSVYILENNKYIAQNYSGSGIIPANALKGCKIDLKGVFPEE